MCVIYIRSFKIMFFQLAQTAALFDVLLELRVLMFWK